VKLLVPFVQELDPVDARLMRLAEFLGITCEALRLPELGRPGAHEAAQTFLEGALPPEPGCLVVNPRVVESWIGGESFPAELASFLVSRFPHLLVHAPRPVAYDASVIEALSSGSLRGTHELEHANHPYAILAGSGDVCEAFAGLSFGPANSANDRVFGVAVAVREGAPPARVLISIDGHPFMAAIRRDKAEIMFLAGQDVVDLNAEVGDKPLVEYFSRLLPHAMVLRYIFGEESWRPSGQHACVIIDDPLLQQNYGFLNFQTLLELTKRHNFHTAIAFIPHNYRRSSLRITSMFRENADRLSLCYHGNDHTGAEFAATDPVLLNTLLEIAEQRIESHSKTTNLSCDRVMVFPQGNFSVEAMRVLKSRNFDAAVNTVPHPRQESNRLTLADIAQPAVLRYGGFPLFLRNDSLCTQAPDIAFNLFFGKPVLIVEHHEIFRHPEPLIEVVSRINAVAPAIHWSNLATVVAGSTLVRRASNACHVHAYSRTVRVSNEWDSTQRFTVEWEKSGEGTAVERMLQDGIASSDFQADGAGTRVSLDLAAGTSQTFSVVHRNGYATLGSLGIRWNTRAYLRRRLSEVRDNYLSKNAPALAAAKTLKRHILH
jgi:hypothetical protein